MKTHKTGPKPAAIVAGSILNSPPVCESTRERSLHGGVTLEEATRARAYQLWERAGCPEDDGVSFWLEAEMELSGHRPLFPPHQ